MSVGKEFLSQLKLYSDYLKWDESLERYETWPEAVDKVLDTHRQKYSKKIDHLLDEVRPFYVNKEILASQRNLQFRGDLIHRNNCKLYNCAVTYAYSPDVFHKGFFVLLSGTGLGVSLRKKYVDQLPPITPRSQEVKLYQVEDSIEGWAEAVKVLISSFVSHPSLYDEYYGYQVKFDFSLVRPEGAYITGGFKAPGPEGLKQSMERIERLLIDSTVEGKPVPFKSIYVYDIFMHLSDAVLSGGVRRSAMNIVMDPDDHELINAKVGNWRQEYPWRARSNNSVGLIRGQFTKEEFLELLNKNQGDNDVGFVFMDHEDDMFNPCFEIGFNFYSMIKDLNDTAIQFCNLTEQNASAASTKKGEFSERKFYKMCRAAAILGTLQAGYTTFPYLGKQTEEIVAGEALLGVSITGWMNRPELFNPEILEKGAQIVLETNEEVANLIGIKTAARSTTVKPSGNASVILKTASGIHCDHSRRFFRVMQLNMESETAKLLKEMRPELLELSSWSNSGTDYVVYVPFESPDNAIFKDDMMGVKHLKLIEMVQQHWVKPGKRQDRGYMSTTEHNVSNTVIIDDPEEITDYIFNNQDKFTAVSFMSNFGDKDYNQAPNTSVLTTEELIEKYGDGAIFMSGLIVDGLHYFNNNLWDATDFVKNRERELIGTREQILLRKNWLRRVKKFSKNYFKGDMEMTIYCMKDVHLWHKWNTINRGFKLIDFTKELKKPSYVAANTLGAAACSGDGCEVRFI